MDGPTLGLLIMYLLLAAFCTLVAALIMRAIFMIPTITNNLIQQTALLRDIADTQKKILKNQEEVNK